MALSWFWLIAVAGTYFLYSATVEEPYMKRAVPRQVPAYKRSTKMLLPFIF